MITSKDEKEKPSARILETDSGIPVDPVYTTLPKKDLDIPGEFPFTRGIYPEMYRKQLWTMRQYAGFGTARDTNKRFKYMMKRGLTGLSVAFDLPTQLGLDSDHLRSEGEVGKVGVAISTLDNMKELFHGIPLGNVSTSMTINATASTMLSMYIATAEAQGFPRSDLRGTLQNDILKEYAARNTYIYPPEQSLNLCLDIIEFCADEMPKWHPISISGYHIREAGANAIQELAFTFADAIEYVNGVTRRGLPIDSFCGSLSFFFACRNDFFEEIAKFRAARRIWANIVKDQFGSNDKNSMKLKFHAQTSGETLTAQQPMNNIVRVSIQALAAVLGGAQSIHTNSYDEALGLPSEESAMIALRTQQTIAEESGVARTSDPLGGSYYLENLTAEIESRVQEELSRIQRMGGALEAIKSGYIQREIQRSAYEFQKSVDAGERVIVGVNRFSLDRKKSVETLQISPRSVPRQKRELKKFRKRRNYLDFQKALSKLENAASKKGDGRQNLVPFILEAVKQRATTEEISDALRGSYGEYHSKVRI
ncbi:MAG: methylmalonyl-CoA mutase [Nitrososphaerales archaeon]